jgi:hypothetical protein
LRIIPEATDMQAMIVGLMKFVGISLAWSCLQSPLAWSPDGQWLAYTLEDAAPGSAPRAGWLFDPGRVGRPGGIATDVERESGGAAARRFRIWVSSRDAADSVMLEESAWPLSAPGWAPEGHRLAYLRFRPRAGTEVLPAGRWELVVQDALDRKQVVLTLPEIELGREQFDAIPAIQPLWSPDGQSLLVARPGPEPAILVVAVDRRSIRTTLVGATQASWSPEGTRLAAVVPSPGDASEQRLQVLGADFGPLRTIAGLGLISEPPVWNADGQSILVAGRRAQTRARGLEVFRIQADSGFSTSVLPILALPRYSRSQLVAPPGMVQIGGPLPRVSLGFDRNQDQCAFAAEVPGQEPVIGFCNVRVPQTSKRFPAIDISLRIGVLAMHPEGQTLAVRVEGAEKSGPAFLCDPGSEEVTPLAPDPSARREWLATLSDAARGLLRAALPEVSVDGRSVPRASLLPLAGEIPGQSQIPGRLRRIAKVGQRLLQPASGEASAGSGARWPGLDLDEYRLFFGFLAGDAQATEAVLDEMESKTSSTELRLRLLAARAQLLHAQGQAERARAMIDYLLNFQRPETRVVEDTPAGLVLARADDPTRDWLLYVSGRLAQPPEKAAQGAGTAGEDEDNEIDLRLPGPFFGPQGLNFDGRPRPQVRFGPMPGAGPRFGGPAGLQPGGPFIPGRFPGALPPLPPRPLRPEAPLLPRFQRPDRRL